MKKKSIKNILFISAKTANYPDIDKNSFCHP